MAQNIETFEGGGKGCKIQFNGVVLEGDENLDDDVEEPEWPILPAVSWCQYGECYLQNWGLVENPR
jgi:hypothetical protein